MSGRRPEAGSRELAVIVTAEHGGNEVPDAWAHLFHGREALLVSHRGWDPGTLDLAERLSRRLQAPLVVALTTRLLVDLNRSPHNPRIFSEVTMPLPGAERRALVNAWHRPHWERVERLVEKAVEGGATVLHLAVHSFTPLLRGVERRPDLALLYDPRRPGERALADAWVRSLRVLAAGRVVRRNDPYRGRDDGLTTALRRRFAPSAYVGIEIEVAQKHLDAGGRFPGWVEEALAGSLEEAVGEAGLPARPRQDRGGPVVRGASARVDLG